MSPLLAFRDAAHEAAALACLQRVYERHDKRLFTSATLCLLLVSARLAQIGGPAAAAATAAALGEAALLSTLGLLSWRRKAGFRRWRSLVMGAFYALHAQARRPRLPQHT